MMKVKADIHKLQLALKDIMERQKNDPEVTCLIHQIISDYAMAKELCSNYKEISTKMDEITDRYHRALSTYYINDKLWWPAYGKAVAAVKAMLYVAQDMGYPGLTDDAAYPTAEDFERNPSKPFEPNSAAAIKLISTMDKRQQPQLIRCIVCSKSFDNYSIKV